MPFASSAHVGHNGKFSGLRLGTHSLPQSALTGVPMTRASVTMASALRFEAIGCFEFAAT